MLHVIAIREDGQSRDKPKRVKTLAKREFDIRGESYGSEHIIGNG